MSRRAGEMEMAKKLMGWYEKGLLPCKPEWDKRNPQADPVQCGTYRLDFAFVHDTGVAIVEYDPDCHKGYNKRCELVRQYTVSSGYGGRPVHWLRFNPSYFSVDGKVFFDDEMRDAMLLEYLQTALHSPDFDNPIKVDYLFYKPMFGGAGGTVQSFKFPSYDAYCDWVEQVAPEKNATDDGRQAVAEVSSNSGQGGRPAALVPNFHPEEHLQLEQQAEHEEEAMCSVEKDSQVSKVRKVNKPR